jgi:arylsulfatase A-like enzyme
MITSDWKWSCGIDRLAWAVALLAMTPASGAAQPSGRPNVVIIYSDDQGFADAGFNSHSLPIHTPNLDRLAREGISFPQGYVCAATCVPSRAGLLSGRYPGRLGIYTVDDPFQEMPVTTRIAPQFFREAGYATGIIGKWHLGGEVFPERYPTRRGFDRFYGWLNSTHDYWKADVGRSDLYGPAGYAPVFDQETPVDSLGEYLTRTITRKAVEFIDSNAHRPFFLYVPHHCAHVPLQVPRASYDRFQGLGLGDNTQTTRAMYLELDEGVGCILERLEHHGIRDNTIVIFQSDNGGGEPEGQLNGIFRGGKFTLLEGGIRVPTLVSWPARLPKGRIFAHPVMNIDFLPTLLSAAGIRLGTAFDGIDLLPYLTGDRPDVPDRALCWRSTKGEFAIRHGDWKWVSTANGRGLFHLGRDPEELTDLSLDHPDVVNRLSAMFNAWDAANIPVQSTPDLRRRLVEARKAAPPGRKNLGMSGKFGGVRGR